MEENHNDTLSSEVSYTKEIAIMKESLSQTKRKCTVLKDMVHLVDDTKESKIILDLTGDRECVSEGGDTISVVKSELEEQAKRQIIRKH